jgi:U4/U6 small nuclear ribonucleoprotein PRP31
MRRLKERYEETAMMKQANTRSFGAQAGEYSADAMGTSLGLLDTAEATGAGAIRKNTEKRKMRQANTKNSRKRQAQMSVIAAQGKGGMSGMASSMVFTPVQGMELVNPDANKDRVREANKKWFANVGFQSALPKPK